MELLMLALSYTGPLLEQQRHWDTLKYRLTYWLKKKEPVFVQLAILRLLTHEAATGTHGSS